MQKGMEDLGTRACL